MTSVKPMHFALCCGVLVTFVNFVLYTQFKDDATAVDHDRTLSATHHDEMHTVLTINETPPPAFTFPAAGFLSEGFDLLDGTHRYSVFEWSYDKQDVVGDYILDGGYVVPDQLQVQGPTSDCGQMSDATTSTWGSANGKRSAMSFSMGVSVESGDAKAAFSQSKGFIKYRNKEEGGYSFGVEVSTKSYVYRVMHKRLPPLHPQFKADRDAMGANPSRVQLLDFMRRYGTHYITSAELGGKMYQNSFLKSEYVKNTGVDQITSRSVSGFNFGIVKLKIETTTTVREEFTNISKDSSEVESIAFEGGKPSTSWQDWCASVPHWPVVLEAEIARLDTLLRDDQKANFEDAYKSYLHCSSKGTYNGACTCDDHWTGDACNVEDEKDPVVPLIPGPKGTSFVHWGRKLCPEGTDLVYAGQVAGSHYTHAGSGANLVCMNPTHKATPIESSTADQNGGLLYRTEYETHHSVNGVVELGKFHDHEVPCAVCIAQRPSFMQPGRDDCPHNYEVEYNGYIMSDRYNHNKSTYNCMNAYPETRGDAGNANGALMYTVEARSATSSQYELGREVMCAQCSTSHYKGPVYTRWGDSHCGHHEHAVYHGWVGGAYYTHTGSGSNHLCLQYDAQTFGTDINENPGALIYKTEYETSANQLPSYRALHDQEVPCSVCQVKERPRGTTYMKPAMKHCSSGDHKLYTGYLFAAHMTHRRSEYLCLVHDAEAAHGSSAGNENGQLIYPVEARGSIEGYVDSRELTCTVCSTDRQGDVFYRWGRNECPTGTHRLWNGAMGGARHNHLGGGYNYQCLPDNPQYGEFTDGQQSAGAEIYQVEYVVNGYGLSGLTHLDHLEAVCSACQRVGSVSTVMVPGTNECPTGYITEYAGFLFSGHYTHHVTEYICVDKTATGKGHSGHENYSLLHPVEAELLEGYRNNDEIACVVCTKV
eukprot:GFYU01005216.1.p1 GENE.GFYU01005216.1~~GFYU01005216.1.p1  ORF type:complete len:932 (-),score=275.76 GFYU01005216.1:86-2881(-)